MNMCIMRLTWNFLTQWDGINVIKLVKFETNPKMYIEVTRHVLQTYTQ